MRIGRYGLMALAMAALAASFAAFCPPDALAGGPADADGAAARTVTITVGEIFRVSGWLMYALVLVSFVAVAFVIYFFFVLREGQVVPRALRRELPGKLSAGSLADARSWCSDHPSPLAAVALAAIDCLAADPKADDALLKEVAQTEGSRQAEAIQRQPRYLMDLAAVAPMMGLLGTVLGMVKAFRAVAIDETMARPLVLVDGVQQALYTTVAGLLIAIPAMIFYSYFREKAGTLVSQLETAAMESVTALIRRRSR